MYQLFSIEKITEFCDEQANIIRKYSTAPITHNSTIHFSVNNEKLFSHLDFASFDSYATSNNYKMFLFNCDLWRNLKKIKNFGLWKQVHPTVLLWKNMQNRIRMAT